MAINRYDHWQYKTFESEQTYGLNVEYDFRFSEYISGKIKVGNKFRTKKRDYDRHHEFGNVAAAAGLAEPRNALIDEWGIDSLITDSRRIPLYAFLDPDYDDSDFFDDDSQDNIHDLILFILFGVFMIFVLDTIHKIGKN